MLEEMQRMVTEESDDGPIAEGGEVERVSGEGGGPGGRVAQEGHEEELQDVEEGEEREEGADGDLLRVEVGSVRGGWLGLHASWLSGERGGEMERERVRGKGSVHQSNSQIPTGSRRPRGFRQRGLVRRAAFGGGP